VCLGESAARIALLSSCVRRSDFPWQPVEETALIDYWSSPCGSQRREVSAPRIDRDREVKPKHARKDAFELRSEAEAALQNPRLAHSEELPQDPTQIVCSDRDQVALRNVHQPSEPTSSGAARLADVGERPFDLRAAQALQFAAFRAAGSTSIV
jgi:hypothetical protein